MDDNTVCMKVVTFDVFLEFIIKAFVDNMVVIIGYFEVILDIF